MENTNNMFNPARFNPWACDGRDGLYAEMENDAESSYVRFDDYEALLTAYRALLHGAR